METSYIVGGIVLLLLVILFSVKYVVADKYTLREMLNAKISETVFKSELSSQSGLSQNFTYSIWLYVNNWNYKNGEYKPIFGRFEGLDSADVFVNENETETDSYIKFIKNINLCHKNYSIYTTDKNTNNCDNFKPKPVVTFDKVQNDILIYVPCDKGINDTNIYQCTVSNIPIQKWVNLSITLYNKTLDVYINGKLHKTCVLPNVPDMQYDGDENIHITPGGGFDGYTSKFQFYPQALNPQEIWNIYSNGYGTLASTLGDYQVKMSLIENGSETNSLTI
jgi:hypothetical protein|uniref:LamG-like jellyroll fold domain-containing protein n=1 Tax=viral metagenome TaxID=1070528 RepID=A0A6C0IMU1_9ZZZZ